MSVVYIVEVSAGHHAEATLSIQFATSNHHYASFWIGRFNKIIKDNVERINKRGRNRDGDSHTCFWQDWIYYERPKASFKKIELRTV